MSSSRPRSLEMSDPVVPDSEDRAGPPDDEEAALGIDSPMIAKTELRAAGAVNQMDEDEGTVYNYEHTAFGHYAVDMAAHARRLVERLRSRRRALDEVAAREDAGEALDGAGGVSGMGAAAAGKAAKSGACSDVDLTSLYLITVGVVVAGVSVLCSLLIEYLRKAEWGLYIVTNLSPPAQVVVWLLYTVVVVVLAVGATTVSPMAAGSGIPQMRAILSGVWLTDYLSLRTLAAKVTGTVLASGSGIFIGLEGPYAHISALIAYAVARVPPFRAIAATAALRDRMLLAAAAAGVAANFGGPVGAVLFTIEVTSTYYPVAHYWESFATALISGLLARVINNVRVGNAPFDALIPWDYTSDRLGVSLFEFVFFAAIGALAGLVSAGFVWGHALTVRMLRRLQPKTQRMLSVFRIVVAVLVALITALLRYPGLIGPFMTLAPPQALRALFDSTPDANSWTNAAPSVVAYAALVPVMLLMSMIVAVPSGVFVPLAAFGGGFGRLLGDALVVLFPAGVPLSPNTPINPGVFALAGAAAVAGGVTHSLSASVVMTELTGAVTMLPGMLVAVVVAVSVCQRLSVSLYDSISLERGLPYMPPPVPTALRLVAADLMDRDVVPVPRRLCVEQLVESLASIPPSVEVVPVVDTAASALLVGGITRAELLQLVHEATDMEGAASRAYVAAAIGSGVGGEELRTLAARVASRVLRAELDVPHDPVLTVHETMPLAELHILFFALRLNVVFVLRNGKLVGQVTRTALQKASQPPGALRRLTLHV